MNYVISHYATPIMNNQLHIKIKTNTQVKHILLHYGDQHDYHQVSEETWLWNKHSADMKLSNMTINNHFFEVLITPKNGRCKYYFELKLNDNSSIFYGQKGYYDHDDSLDLYATFYVSYIHKPEMFTPVEWVKEQRWCQIFIDRFANGDPNNDPQNVQAWDDSNLTTKSFYGGDLKGIINKLDELIALGFTGLYLTPIFMSPSNHKYDTIDYYQIDPHFGTTKDLKNLVEQCHQKGMKIILDAVFNHTSDQFKPFLDVKRNKQASKYTDWFYINNYEPLTYETFANVSYMPKLNTHNPEVKKYLIDILLHYLQEFKIDGWRFDVANELDHQFVRDINKAVKTRFPKAYLLAEIWHDPSDWIAFDQFDANMEYEIGSIFVDLVNQTMSLEDAIIRLSEIDYRTPCDRFSSQFHLVDSHDTPRLMTQVNQDLKKALVVLFLLHCQKGSICLFYGTNFLLQGGHDPFSRVCYPLLPTSRQRDIEASFLKIVDFREKYNSILQNESPFYKQKDNQLILDYPSLKISVDLLTLNIEVNGQLFVF